MVLFGLKSYNIVAPYENSDDDYASKIGKSAVAFIPEVTISESEIAKLEKPKFKEVKPKVSKVDKAVEVTSKTGKITEGGSNSIRDLMLQSESSKKWGILDDAVANGNVRNINGKSIYYMDGIANPKKGVVVIVKDGKIQSMMSSDFKSFNKLQ